MPPTFQPLTEQQYQSARSAGFSHDQILQNEQIRKSGTDTPQAPSPKVGLLQKIGSVGKSAFDFVTGAEQGLGQDIASAATAKQASNAQQVATDNNSKYVSTLVAGKKNAEAMGNDTSHWDNQLKTYQPKNGTEVANSISPALAKSNLQIAGDAGGTALDVLSAGTYGAAKTAAMKTGELVLKGGTPTVISAAGLLPKALAERSAAKTAAKVAEDVSPKLTTQKTAEALASGGAKKTPILGKIKLIPSDYIKGVADTVQKYVPKFSSMKTYADKLNAVRAAVNTEAEKLKSDVIQHGADRIYSFKELGAKMNAVEKPIAIKSDTVLARQFDLAKKAALQIAQKAGGKISNLLDARKEFDGLVQKEFPHLWDKENAPMRAAITGMRNTMNDFIAHNLPEVGFRDSLSTQSKMLHAVDNLSEKAAGEVGTTRVGRALNLVKEHPVVTGALGLYGANELLKRATGIGL